MNKSLLGRIGSFLFAFFVLGFGVFFGYYGVFGFSTASFLPSMHWSFALYQGFVSFMDYAVALAAAGIAVAASLAGGGAKQRRAAGSSAQPFSKFAGSTLVTFIVLTVAYTALFEGVYPAANRRLEEMRFRSRMAFEYRDRAKAARLKGDIRAALEAANLSLAIEKEDAEMAALQADLEPKVAKLGVPPAGPAVADKPSAELDAQGYVEKARFYFEKKDWFSAHYYAQAAARIDPRRTDARRLAAEAWEKIAGLEPSSADEKASELYRKKKAAYALLNEGNALAAYYSFLALSQAHPKDKDIANYLEESRQKVQLESFFLEEAQRVSPLPGTQKILFLNGRESGETEAVSIGKMVEAVEGVYFLDIEAIRYDAAGRIIWHFSAPYGKLGQGTILMRCVDRKDAALQYAPVSLQGSRPPEQRNMLAVRPTVEEMRALTVDRGGLSSMGIAELWRMRQDLASFGAPRQRVEVDMAMKILMPFTFLILSLFALSLGWAFRARFADRPSAFAIILVPAVPVVVSLASLMYVHAHRVVIGFSVVAFGITTALAVLAVLEVALFVIALVTLAGQSTS